MSRKKQVIDTKEDDFDLYEIELNQKLVRRAKREMSFKGIQAANRALDFLIKASDDPDNIDPKLRIFLVDNFYQVDRDIKHFPKFPKLTTFEDINVAEENILNMVSEGILSIEDAERLMRLCKERAANLEIRLVENEIRRIKSKAENTGTIQETLGDVKVETLLKELTSRSVSHEDKMLILNTIKDNFIKKPG